MIEDVCFCFICGADTGTCGHLEEELLMLMGERRQKQWEPRFTNRFRVYTRSRQASDDPTQLTRGRMPWPENVVTPELAFARKAHA